MLLKLAIVLFLSHVSSTKTKNDLNKIDIVCEIFQIKDTFSQECQEQLKTVCQHDELWYKMWDASTKDVHTGLTASNNLDFGDYDACIGINYEDGDKKIRGKHCPLSYVTQIWIPEKIWRERVGPNEQKALYSNVTLKGSMCIPDGCTPKEFNEATELTRIIPHIVTDLIVSECYTTDTRRNLETSNIIAFVILGLIIVALIFSTALDVYLHYTTKASLPLIFQAFSIFHNGKQLMSISEDKVDRIQCMNGIRFICMLWVIAGHGFVSWETLPHVNQKDTEEWKTKFYSQYIATGIYAVDTFFLLSGFLTAYMYLRKSHKLYLTKQIMAVPLMYIHRYLRITPAIAALFFIGIYIFPFLGYGPMWFKYYDVVTQPCLKYWPRFFTYTANYFDAKDLCFVHTWYLSADMQMFLLSPFILIPTCLLLHRKFTSIILSISGLTLLFVAISIAVQYAFDFKNEYDTHSRMSDYLIGIIGGICFYKYKGKNIIINKWVNILMWLICILLMFAISMILFDKTNHPTKDINIIFPPVSKPIWSLCILWIIFSCYFGYGGIINWFLSLPIFQIGAKLSYSMYIVHGLVVLYKTSSTRTYLYFDDFTLYYWWCGHVVTCVVISLFWTFAFETPMIAIEKIIFGGGKRK